MPSNLKPPCDPLAKTWPNPDAARMWLKRNPQPGLVVKFDNKLAVFRLISDGSVQVEPVAVETITPVAEVEVPEFAQEPDMKKPVIVTKAKALKIVPAAAPKTTLADPTNSLLCEDVSLVVTGVPSKARALEYASEIVRKTQYAVDVYQDGLLVGTVDPAYLKAAKQAKAALPRKATEPKPAKTAPEGKRLDVVNLCMRKQGATTKELVALTGWNGCPWRWTITSNKNGTGLADRYGYGHSVGKNDAGEVVYFLTAPAEAA